MSDTWLKVWKIKSDVALPDLHMPPGRHHHAILVETNPDDKSGRIHHVVGDVTSAGGMSYSSRPSEEAEQSGSCHAKEFIGYTPSSSHPAQWDDLLRALPTPPQQKASNPAKMGRVEPFKQKLGPYEYIFYEDGEERTPLWKCTEWVNDHALPALYSRGLVQVQTPNTDESQASSSPSQAAKP